MSLGRTGSTHLTLSKLFACQKSKVYITHEFLDFVTTFINIHFLKPILKIPKSFVDFMCNLVKFTEGSGNPENGNGLLQKLDWLKIVDLLNIRQKKDSYYIHDNDYSLNMIDDFANKLVSTRLRYFIHKHISQLQKFLEMNGLTKKL